MSIEVPFCFGEMEEHGVFCNSCEFEEECWEITKVLDRMNVITEDEE